MQTNKLSTKDLVALYNKLTDKTISKFSSREAGERQVNAIVKMITKEELAEAIQALGIVEQDTVKPAVSKPTKEPTKVPAPAKTPKAKKEAQPAANRSDAIAASWKDPKVAAKRAERTHVKASNTVYRSVREAFVALGLPLEKHIKFRMKLKQVAEMTFKHEGRAISFKVVQD